MSLCHAAELGFPVTVEYYPVDLAPAGVCFVATGLGRVEIDVCRGTNGIVGIEDCLNRDDSLSLHVLLPR